jgi:hypothetical protein
MQYQILCALDADSPKWLAKEFFALAAMEFVQELFEVARRRSLITFQSKQPRDFLVVEGMHFRGH